MTFHNEIAVMLNAALSNRPTKR